MAFAYKNSKGQTYYLHAKSVQRAGGKESKLFFFAREIKGGALAHGSVVAREYGIPAVVGVREATQKIRTGQRLRVDGNRGVVEIL